MKITGHSISYAGKRFFAGGCYVAAFGKSGEPAVALRAGRKRRITTYEHAVHWLTTQGLAKPLALALVDMAREEIEQ